MTNSEKLKKEIEKLKEENSSLKKRIKELENKKSYSSDDKDWHGFKETTPYVTTDEAYGYKESMPWKRETKKDPWEGVR